MDLGFVNRDIPMVSVSHNFKVVVRELENVTDLLGLRFSVLHLVLHNLNGVHHDSLK